MPEENIAISNIIDTNRVRSDYGDLDSLMDSIKEYGIIQPIVLVRRGDGDHLVAGGRRLEALRRLHTETLVHSKQFIWREELDDHNGRLRLQAVEMEENLKRKDLSWSEIALGKQKLLALMQELKGVGGPGRGNTDGFSQKSLAAMLGEDEATTSRDLELAGFVTQFPTLASLPTPTDARRKIQVAATVAAMQSVAKQRAAKQQASREAACAAGLTPPAEKIKLWELHHGRFEDNISHISDNSTDLVLTDLPYDIGLGDSTASHGAGLGQFADTNIDLSNLLPSVAVESYRILRPNRFAVFFYGMAYHQEFIDALSQAGFIVDPYPFIWRRNRTAPPSPSRYAKTYDPALIASKGLPILLRPNLGNFMDYDSVSGSNRLHSAQKPVEVMERFVLDMTAEGATVVDLMAGSGSTGVASVKNKRHCILFELVEQNCLLIESRLGAL